MVGFSNMILQVTQTLEMQTPIELSMLSIYKQRELVKAKKATTEN